MARRNPIKLASPGTLRAFIDPFGEWQRVRGYAEMTIFRNAYIRHFGGLSWRSASGRDVALKTRARQAAKIMVVHTHLWRARLGRWGVAEPA